MTTSNDPSWVTMYVEQGELPARELDQAVLCGELVMALSMDQCLGTDHLSSIVAMVERRVPPEIRGDVEKVANWADSKGKAIFSVVWRLMQQKQKLAKESL